MGRSKRSLTRLEDSIRDHVTEQRGDTSIVTGWVLVASVSDSEDANIDGYITQTSEALNHHNAVGLLTTAIDDRRNIGLLSTIQAVFLDDDDAD